VAEAEQRKARLSKVVQANGSDTDSRVVKATHRVRVFTQKSQRDLGGA